VPVNEVDVPTTDAIVVIAAEGLEPRKVVRIVGSRDGSFSISVPYYPFIAGEIHKTAAPVAVQPDHSAWVQPIDRHRSKGHGIHSYPILSPIETGPTFGVLTYSLASI